jgi:hypothetical protein
MQEMIDQLNEEKYQLEIQIEEMKNEGIPENNEPMEKAMALLN